MGNEYAITVDQSAVDRINALRGTDGRGPRALLRIAVDGGGCSGFQYEMEFTEEADPAAGDRVFAETVVIDEASLGIMNGSVISFRDSLMGAQFVIDNPNAASGCGCGASFAVK